MKPQLYSIVILLFTRINYAQNAENSTQVNEASATQQPPTDKTTSLANPPEGKVTTVTQAPSDHKTSAPKTTEDKVTSVTDASEGNTTSVTETPTDKGTVLSEAPNSQTASAPSSLAPIRTTKGFTTTTGSGDTPRATRSTSISIGNQTSKPVMAGNATTRRSSKVTSAVRKTTKLISTKSTTGNRTSAFPVPSLFAIILLVVSVLCF